MILEDYAKARVSTYLAGMRRRLDIAMNLMENPDTFFLDESTTGFDRQNHIATSVKVYNHKIS